MRQIFRGPWTVTAISVKHNALPGKMIGELLPAVEINFSKEPGLSPACSSWGDHLHVIGPSFVSENFGPRAVS